MRLQYLVQSMTSIIWNKKNRLQNRSENIQAIFCFYLRKNIPLLFVAVVGRKSLKFQLRNSFHIIIACSLTFAFHSEKWIHFTCFDAKYITNLIISLSLSPIVAFHRNAFVDNNFFILPKWFYFQWIYAHSLSHALCDSVGNAARISRQRHWCGGTIQWERKMCLKRKIIIYHHNHH